MRVSSDRSLGKTKNLPKTITMLRKSLILLAMSACAVGAYAVPYGTGYFFNLGGLQLEQTAGFSHHSGSMQVFLSHGNGGNGPGVQPFVFTPQGGNPISFQNKASTFVGFSSSHFVPELCNDFETPTQSVPDSGVGVLGSLMLVGLVGIASLRRKMSSVRSG